MSKKIRIFLVGCLLMAMCCMGITAGASVDTKAEVVAHNLTITDAGINVNFYVDIQGDVTVTLNDTEVEVPETTETIIIDAKAYNCYKFTQPVVAKEMDQKVSLVIKSGDEPIVEDSYCVNDYAASVIGDEYKYNYNYEELVKAMTYYGDFAETYLKYEADKADTTKAEAFLQQFDESAKTDLVSETYAIVKGENPDGIEATGIQLNLVSEVSIRLNFNVTDDKALDYEFTAVSGDDTKNLGTLKKGSYNGTAYYYVDIENIGADALDKAYTIKVGNTTVLSNCSALSYARAALKSETASDSLVDLAKALYLYNQKAKTYVSSQATAVYDIFYSSEGFSATPDEFTPVYLTGNDDVTTEETDEQVTKLSQLNGSRTKGSSIWMTEAYTVAADENVTTGPYVIRRYTGNSGNVLNVAGTATLNTKVDGSLGSFVAKYPGGTETVSFESNGSVAAGNSLVNVAAGATFTINDTSIQNSHVENGEVYVSGTPAAFKITGDAKSGVVTVASGVTGVTINVEGLTVTGEEEQVVLASHAGQSLTGNGEASAVTLIDDGDEHFGVVKHNNNVRIASVICVCGDDVTGETGHTCPWTNDIEKVYNISWEAYTATKGYMPGYNLAKYYYLTNDFTISGKSEVKVESYLDLNGCTITAYNGWNVYINGENASYSVADSKGNGTIQMPSDFNAFAYGSLIHIRESGASFHLYGGTIDLSNVSNVQYWLIDINQGEFFMHGGMIKPAKSKQSASSTCIGMRSAGKLCVTGGTIYGDVAHYSTGTITVGGNAEVGLQWENFADYGILGYSGDTRPIVCDNLKKDAKIVLASKANFALSEKAESDSFVSGFELVTGGEDGHYGVVKKSDGTLAFSTTICVCGENVSDNHDHTCAWVESQTNGIADVYSINWQETGTMPTEGCYYLTQDITLTAQAKIETTCCLDLNGKTITASDGLVNIYIAADANYSIGDSQKGQGTIKFPENSELSGKFGPLINVAEGGQANLYSGTIDMTAVLYAEYPPIESKGTFTMHGGIIKPVQTDKQGNCIDLRNAGSVIVNGGIIYGEIQFWSSATGSLTVKNNAQVGLQLGENAGYGIISMKKGVQLISDNVNGDAQIIIGSGNIVLSGTGVASAFTPAAGFKIVETDGELSMVVK